MLFLHITSHLARQKLPLAVLLKHKTAGSHTLHKYTPAPLNHSPKEIPDPMLRQDKPSKANENRYVVFFTVFNLLINQTFMNYHLPMCLSNTAQALSLQSLTRGSGEIAPLFIHVLHRHRRANWLHLDHLSLVVCFLPRRSFNCSVLSRGRKKSTKALIGC